jgi:hypothetical protein
VRVKLRVYLALVNAKAPLCALADILLVCPDFQMTIRRCGVFQKRVGPPWASLPRLSVHQDGRQKFVDLIELPRALKDRVLEAVLAEYRRKANSR